MADPGQVVTFLLTDEDLFTRVSTSPGREKPGLH